VTAFIFMSLTGFVVSRGVASGIEKSAKILMPSLVIMLLGLLFYSLTLPNAMIGVKYYLVPEFSEINVRTIGGALRQAFFSLSLGMGTIITYGSYLSKKENIINSAVAVTFFDVGIACLAGLLLFPLIAYSTGGDLSNVQGGAGLIFAALPSVFESLGPGLGNVMGALFFLLLSFAALTSTVSLLEVPVAYLVDERKISRQRATIIVATIIFLVGIPSLLGNGYSAFFSSFITYVGASSGTDFMTFLGHIADTMLLFGGLMIVSFAAYTWKKENLHEELAQGYEGYHESRVKIFIGFAINYLCPVVISILLVLVVLGNFFGFDIINS